MLSRSLSTHVYTISTTLKATFFAHSFVSLFLPFRPGVSVYDIRVWQHWQMLSLCHLSSINAHTSMLHASHNPCTQVVDWITTEIRLDVVLYFGILVTCASQNTTNDGVICKDAKNNSNHKAAQHSEKEPKRYWHQARRWIVALIPGGKKGTIWIFQAATRFRLVREISGNVRRVKQ